MSIDLETEADDEKNAEGALTELNSIVATHGLSSDLRRFDVRGNLLEATYYLNVDNPDDLSQLSSQLRSKYPKIGMTFIDQNNLPSV